MYDNYVSLGRNCEVAFQFRRLLGKDVACYFNWLWTPLTSLVRIIDNDFAGAFEKDHLEATQDKMVLDHVYGIKYHSPFWKELGTELSGARFHELHTQALGKIELFKNRFRTLANSKKNVLYFITTTELDARERAAELRDILVARYPHHDFRVLVLMTEDRREADWAEDRIHNRYLERFAPVLQASDAHQPSWDRIFTEFPLAPGAMQTPV
jgi:hypothetical protein